MVFALAGDSTMTRGRGIVSDAGGKVAAAAGNRRRRAVTVVVLGA